MDKIELLAPCGSMESVYAAVQNGADAVYMGGSRFSARAYASNFDDEKIIEAVDYCHLYGVKVHVTVNTLMKDSEMKDVLEYIKFLYEIGVDALIVQDTGLVYLIKKNFPRFELHASTQLTIHNGEGAKFFKEAGFTRIVLSRELSAAEIKHISEELNIETEIFIHGALCVCYSGQCLMSSIIGGRSGNRGRCAQPCRLPYTLINKEDCIEFNGYLLSPKDVCMIDSIDKIIDNKTTSLKIEGRMKRPEYVAGVVDIYRRAIDAAYKKEAFDFNGETKKLMQLFNREGFSSGYLLGNLGRDMMAYSFPKNTGIVLGTVDKDRTITLEEPIAVKDGVRVGEEGFAVSSIIKNGKEVTIAMKGDKVKLMPENYKINDTLYKTLDVELLARLSNTFKDHYRRKIEIDINCEFILNKSFEISTVFQGKEFKATGEVIQTPLKRPLDKEKIKENLMKTGNTPFSINSINFNSFEEGFLQVSNINLVRRNLLNSLANYICSQNKRSFQGVLNFNREEKRKNKLQKLFVSVENLSQLEACREEGIETVIINPFNRKCNIDINEIKHMDVYLKVPNIIKEEFSKVCSIIDENAQNIKGIVTSNAGIMKRYKNKLQIIGDYKLNIFNKYSLDFYKSILEGVCISVELNKKEIGELIKNSPIPTMMLVYGKPELMVSEYCVIGSTLGGKTSISGCNKLCEKGSYKLRDRKDEELVIEIDKYCRSHIYNYAAINLIPNLKELNVSSHRIDFIDETKSEAKKVLKAYKSGTWTGDFENYTRGYFKRGVE